jgi:hypothetical protein
LTDRVVHVRGVMSHRGISITSMASFRQGLLASRVGAQSAGPSATVRAPSSVGGPSEGRPVARAHRPDRLNLVGDLGHAEDELRGVAEALRRVEVRGSARVMIVA